MQKKKVMKEESFILLTREEMEKVQGGGTEEVIGKIKKTIGELFNAISNRINL